jgi:phosphatidyl-myo-inositol alpha-mannosyltransferase
MPLKIGMVSEYYFPLLGGMTEHVLNVSNRLARKGFNIKIITSNSDENKIPEKLTGTAGANIIRVGRSVPLYINGSVGRITMGWNLRVRIREMLEEEKFDLLHLHSPTVLTLPVFTLMEANCTCFGTYHTYFDSSMLYSLFRNRVQRMAIDKLAGQIAVSRSCIDAMRRYFTLNPRIIPNGVDVDVFHPNVPPLEKFMDGKKNILFMGRFDPRNGLSLMLKAFIRIREEYSGVRLIIVGDGPFRNYYKNLIPAGLKEDVSFVGRVWEERPRYYATCDIFCSPISKASFGVTLLEAMAAGKPIVATENTGYREVLDGTESLLVPQGDPAAFADSVLHLLRNDSLRAEMGECGRAKALTYSWDSVVDRIVEYYREVIDIC